MHEHAKVIQSFYSAFAARDANGMVRCYHRDVTFSDSVFVGLDAVHARGMWRMLAERAKDIRIETSRIEANDSTGSAHWDAYYTFAATGRPVVNRIDATFEFRDGKIYRHTDVFDLWRWARQALGAPGLLFGWTPMLQASIRRKGRAGLDAYLLAHPEAGEPAAP